MAFRTRDPIHNFITLPDDLAGVVNCSALQRLRGIRQLAMASLVYHGAVHTRFDHTLGVAHVAGMMAEWLRLPPGEQRLVQLAGLLHDAGHGPFSHVSEMSLDRYGDPSKLRPDQKEHKIHEVVTAEIIRTDPGLEKVLSAPEREDVIRLLGDWGGRPALRQIVSGPLDADKQDYLLRDGHFCGVRYGDYDLHQLHRSLLLPEAGPDDLMIDEDGVHAVEQFVLAKYYMTLNVYRHRVRLITDQMITRAIRLGIDDDGLEPMARLYRFDGSPEFVRGYQSWDDARFLETFCPMWQDPPGPKSGAMLRRLRERKLLKLVYSDEIGRTYDARIREAVKALSKPTSDAVRGGIEATVATFLERELGRPVDPTFVIAHSYGVKSARESSRNENEGILVAVRPGPRYFEEVSTLFRSMNEAYSDNFVEVYAPIVWPADGSKDALRARWKDAIRDVIQAACRKGKS